MIELDVSKIEFSKWDEFFHIKVPNVLDEKLAYETGLHIGDVNISGKKNLAIWLKEVGFKNPVHITKLQVWQKFGACPQNTTIEQRKALLSLGGSVSRASPW